METILITSNKTAMKEKLGTEPALPTTVSCSDGTIDFIPGMSKRFYAACAAMHGILSNSDWVKSAKIPDDFDEYRNRVVSASFDFADELLKQEQEGK